MNARFHDFANEIVKQTDEVHVDKEDLYIEVMNHLEKSKAKFVKDGFDEKQAEQKAMENFRNISEVAGQVQQPIFPFMKMMLLTLAVTSIVYSFATSSIWLYLENDTNIVWFMISVINSSFIYVCAVKPISRKLWLNTVLIIHIFIYFFGAVLIFGLKDPISTILGLLSLFIVLLSIVLVSLTLVYHKQSSKHKLSKQTKLLHVLNITTGIILVGATKLVLWLLLAFSGEMTLAGSVIFSPLFIWFITYILQIKYITKNNKQVAYGLAVIPVFLLIVIIAFSIRLIFA